MWARLIFAILSVSFITGCTSPLKKSVLHPLKAREIDRVVGKDKSFLTTYSIVEEKWNHISTHQDSARWKDITYGRLHTYLQTINSNELNSPLFSKLRQKWEELNTRNNIAADEYIAKWKMHMASNSPDSLAQVSFSGVELEMVRNRKKEIDTLVKARIRINALKGKIDSLSFSYSFVADSISGADSSELAPAVNTYSHRRAVNDSAVIKVFPGVHPLLRQLLVAGDTAVKFNYSLNSVYFQGKLHNADSLKKEVPAPVLALIEGESGAASPDFDANHYREQIIRGEIDPGFISQSAYVKINAEQYYRQLDSLVFSYINYRGAL